MLPLQKTICLAYLRKRNYKEIQPWSVSSASRLYNKIPNKDLTRKSMNFTIDICLTLLSAGGITALLIPEIIKIAYARKIVDKPGERKLHVKNVPTFGGIGIFFGFLISLLVWSFTNMGETVPYFLGGILVIVVVGMRDDFLPLSAAWKLVGQICAASVIIFFADIHFDSLYGFLGFNEINPIIGYFITLFTIIVITNSFNLIDGIDGLAGTVGIIVFSFFGVWFALEGNRIVMIMCFSMIGALIGFLGYNFSPAKIFMGDTGSLLLGFAASGLTLLFLRDNAHLPDTSPVKVGNPVALISAVLVYPLFDTIRVFVLRIRRGRSPFSPDKMHIHHMLLDLGMPHLQATLIIASLNLLFILVMLSLSGIGLSDNILVPVLVVCAAGITSLLRYYSDKKRVKVTL